MNLRRKPDTHWLTMVVLLALLLSLLFISDFTFQVVRAEPLSSTSRGTGYIATDSQITTSSAAITSNQVITEYPINGRNPTPNGIATDSNGNVWFADDNTDQIGRFIPSNGSESFFQIPTTPPGPQHYPIIWFLTFDKNSDLWFIDESQPYIWRFTPSSGKFANFTTGFGNPHPYALAYDPGDQTLWFASIYSDEIGFYNITADESLSQPTLIGVPTVGSPQCPVYSPIIGPGPDGFSIDSNGDVFISEAFASAIVEYSQSAHKFTNSWIIPGCAQPTGVLFDSSLDMVWFANHATSLIGYVNLTSGSVRQIATSPDGVYIPSTGNNPIITLPYWIQSSNGYIWFNEHIGNKITRMNPFTLQFTEFTVPTNESTPIRFAIDNRTGLVWFVELASGKLGVLDENQSLDDLASLSVHNATLSSVTISVTVNLPNFQVYAPLVSGSLSEDGYVDSNLSVSTSRVNSSAFDVNIGRGANLTSGQFTLSICPTLSPSDSPWNPPPVRSCGVMYLTVVSPLITPLELYIIVGAIILAVAGVSIWYVRRWKRE